MSKDLSIPGMSASSSDFFAAQPDDSMDNSPWTTADLALLSDYLGHIHSGQPITPVESTQVTAILVNGIEHSATRSQVLADLLQPELNEQLGPVLEQADLPGFSPENQADLLEIANEADQSQKIVKLAHLVMRTLDDKTNPENGLPLPLRARELLGRLPVQGELRTIIEKADGNANGTKISQEVLSQLNELTTQQDTNQLVAFLQEIPDPIASLLATEGNDTWAILVHLAEHPEMGELSIEAQTVIQVALRGEASPSNDLSSSDIDSLIQDLGSTDPKVYRAAMRELYEYGDGAIPHLQLAKADPATKVHAGDVLQWIFSGEKPTDGGPADAFLPYHYDNAIRPSDLDPARPGLPTPQGSPTSLDIDYLSEQLRNPQTSLSTINSLIQIGQPAIPALCEILMRQQ